LQNKHITPARITSLELLNKILVSNEPFEKIINSSKKFLQLDDKDKRFTRLIITTILRKFGQIDFIMNRFIKKGSIKKNNLKNIIRIGIAELIFIKSAKYAAINEAVETTKINYSNRLSKFTNAVLRNIDRNSEKLSSIITDEMNYPTWLIEDWKQTWGIRQTKENIRYFQKEPYLDISVAGDPKEMERVLKGKNIYNKTLRIDEIIHPSKLPFYQTENSNYHWWVQDVAASIPAQLLIDSDKMTIVDLCAAPGGKTIQLLKASKKVIPVDVSKERIKILEQNLKRLNLKQNIVVADGRKWRPKEKIDAVLLDAPCTATGTIRKHPDIVKNRSKVNLDKYISLQIDLIKQCLMWLDKGGILIYAVCSLQKKEGEEQIKSILQTENAVEILPIKPSEVLGFSQAITKEGWLRVFPSILSSSGGNDGFFICRLQKK
tara:strand:+ start:248 stop:1549 length:1302 start_codon:yes stop_codon:yes gene_type:complete